MNADVVADRGFQLFRTSEELSLEAWFQRLEGKGQVRVVCMDLSSSWRSLVRKHFPNARIVADRFHVIRLINHYFLACWRELDPVGGRNRGLLSLMRHEINTPQFVAPPRPMYAIGG